MDDALVAGSAREIMSTRWFNWPRERLFDAWTDPEQLRLWWGPKGFRNSFETFEPQPGGEWRFVMHGPNGADYPNLTRIVTLEAPSLIVLDHLSDPKFRMVQSFETEAGGTRLTWRQQFATEELCARIRRIAEPANEENFDRLAAHLAQWAGSKPD